MRSLCLAILFHVWAAVAETHCGAVFSVGPGATNEECQQLCYDKSDDFDTLCVKASCFDMIAHGYISDGSSDDRVGELAAAESPSDCQQQCQESPICLRWIYHTFENGDPSKCLLKSHDQIAWAVSIVLREDPPEDHLQFCPVADALVRCQDAVCLKKEEDTVCVYRLEDEFHVAGPKYCDDFDWWTVNAPPTPAVVPVAPKPAEAVECDALIEFMLLQDLSFSFKNDLPNLRALVPELMDHISEAHPGSRFGLASYTDKPIPPLGSEISKDYCWRLHAALTTDKAKVESRLDKLRVRSGKDWWESQMDALYHAVLSNEVGWSQYLTDLEAKRILRVAAVATDSGFHVAGDGAHLGLYPNNGDALLDCLKEDYVSLEQVENVLQRSETSVLFLVTRDVFPIYMEVVKQFAEVGIVGVVAEISDDSSNIVQAVLTGLREVWNIDTFKQAPSMFGQYSLMNPFAAGIGESYFAQYPEGYPGAGSQLPDGPQEPPIPPAAAPELLDVEQANVG